jgi:hypothetical protein
MEKKVLSEITRAEWIAFQWQDITEMGDEERLFLKSNARTPDEAAQAMEDWDTTAEERGVAAEPDEPDCEQCVQLYSLKVPPDNIPPCESCKGRKWRERETVVTE